MKYFQILIITSVCFFSCSDEKPIIDSLINRISNQQIGMTQQMIRLPEMKSLSADSLIQIGKPATEKLIAILDDTSKGIIAHYILTSIWYDTLQKNSLLDYTPVWNSEDEGKGISNFENGLKFYYNDEFGIYTERKELERNKHKWQKFIYTINLKQSIHY